MAVLNINLLRQEQRRTSRLSQTTTVVLVATGGVVLLTLLVAVFLYTSVALRTGQKEGLATQTQEFDAQIAEMNKVNSPFYPDMDLAEQAKGYQGQVNAAGILVENHKYFTLYLSEIAENTPPAIVYTSFTSDALNRLAVSGTGDSYQDVAKLVERFKSLSFAKNATLQEAKLDPSKVGKRGSVSFVMVIELKPASELKNQIQPNGQPLPRATGSPNPAITPGANLPVPTS